MELKPLKPNELRSGLHIVSFEHPGLLFVGRIQGAIKRPTRLQTLLTGVLATFDLLLADEHEEAGDRIWQTYFFGNADAPQQSGVFKWPNLLPLHFVVAEKNLNMGRTGRLMHIEIRSPHIERPIVIEEEER